MIIKPWIEFISWMHYLIYINYFFMLQNKIFQNYFIEILKTFLIIVFGLSFIALTVRAVNFLELVVDNGYPVSIYFQYSLLNLFGIAPKFIPLSFLVSLAIFIINHKNDSEFLILWTSGIKKIKIVNLIFLSAIIVSILYLFFSTLLTPLALNKSRHILSQDKLNSFLPTVKSQQFSDSFKGLTFFVEKKINNEVKNIFLHDTGNNLKKFSSNVDGFSSATIVSESGVINKRNMFLINGQIISSKDGKIEVINFDQLDINLGDLSTTVIKKPKLQETSTHKLLICIFKLSSGELCNNNNTKLEIIPNLIRRIILPFYIPAVALLCCFLLIKNNSLFKEKFIVFFISFLLLVFTELMIRYTGLNSLLRISYIVLPFLLISTFYLVLVYKLNKTEQSYE